MATNILPPDLAVRLAWSLTGEWSETPTVRDEAVVAKGRLKDLENAALVSNIPAEKEYVPKAVEYIRASQRTLANIYAARKLNFDEVQKLRTAQMEDIQAYSKLTSSWQSAWPRALSVGIGGSAGAMTLVDLVKGYFPSVSPAVIQAYMFIIGAGALYLVNEFIVLPWVRRRLMMERVRGDYDRNLYYDQFIVRTRSALMSLYVDVDRAHKTAFGALYDPQADVPATVNGALAGALSTCCPKVAAHMNAGIVKPNLWSMCETGQGKESCPHWTK